VLSSVPLHVPRHSPPSSHLVQGTIYFSSSCVCACG
jgi:hypothetical protein